MERNFVYLSPSRDGYENLATDEWFLDHAAEGDLILHLYQNENAVIIGKNQNPWIECDLNAMERDGVQLVRRVSGGGAVYHDEGNLNFSFIAGRGRYNQEGQMELILSAVRSLGVPCSFSGRNDLVFEDRKFSGNAFCHRKKNAQHHGTLLVSSDLERLGSYLTPDPKKIRSKGIASVRSRVVNLSELSESISIKSLQKALVSSFEERYGYYGEWNFCKQEREEIAAYRKKHASREWRLGQTPKFDLEWSERFSFGGIRLLFSFAGGRIEGVKAYSDALETELCREIEERLCGLPFTHEAVKEALSASSFPECQEMAKQRIVP